MIKIDLAALARQHGIRRRRAVLRPIEPGRRAEREYLDALLDMVAQIEAEVAREVIPRFEAERMSLRHVVDRLEGKATGERFSTVFEALRRFKDRLTGAVEGLVSRIFRAEAERHTERFTASVRDALGIDVGQLIQAEDLTDALSLAALRNAALIRDVGEQVTNRVARATLDALAQGRTVAQYREELQREFGFARNRAQLIARNEIGSLNAQMNRMRQEQAGVTRYRWSSSRDERVRPLHAQLDGTEHEWGKPGPAENGGHPGEPINCRCTARAVISLED